MPLGSDKRRNQSAKAKINKHEEQLAQKLGGVRQPASGAGPKHKGDIKVGNFLLDSKETIHGSIIVSAHDLGKISMEASAEGKYPGLIITLATKPGVINEWAVVPLELFGEMLDKLKETKAYGSNGL